MHGCITLRAKKMNTRDQVLLSITGFNRQESTQVDKPTSKLKLLGNADAAVRYTHSPLSCCNPLLSNVLNAPPKPLPRLWILQLTSKPYTVSILLFDRWREHSVCPHIRRRGCYFCSTLKLLCHPPCADKSVDGTSIKWWSNYGIPPLAGMQSFYFCLTLG
jgi:hypothetical protein